MQPHNPSHFQAPTSLIVTDRNNSISVAMNIYHDGNTGRPDIINATYPHTIDVLRSKEGAGQDMP